MMCGILKKYAILTIVLIILQNISESNGNHTKSRIYKILFPKTRRNVEPLLRFDEKNEDTKLLDQTDHTFKEFVRESKDLRDKYGYIYLPEEIAKMKFNNEKMKVILDPKVNTENKRYILTKTYLPHGVSKKNPAPPAKYLPLFRIHKNHNQNNYNEEDLQKLLKNLNRIPNENDKRKAKQRILKLRKIRAREGIENESNEEEGKYRVHPNTDLNNIRDYLFPKLPIENNIHRLIDDYFDYNSDVRVFRHDHDYGQDHSDLDYEDRVENSNIKTLEQLLSHTHKKPPQNLLLLKDNAYYGTHKKYKPRSKNFYASDKYGFYPKSENMVYIEKYSHPTSKDRVYGDNTRFLVQNRDVLLVDDKDLLQMIKRTGDGEEKPEEKTEDASEKKEGSKEEAGKDDKKKKNLHRRPPWLGSANYNSWTYFKPHLEDDCPGDQVRISGVCSWTPPHRKSQYDQQDLEVQDIFY